VVKPGQALSVIPQGDLVITNAALGAELADPSGRTSVKLTYMRPVKVTDDDEDDEEKDDEDVQVETVLCSLTPGKVFVQFPGNLIHEIERPRRLSSAPST
jgi:FK506-binding nuclear protein